MVQVDIILITWNRLEYTKLCLEALSKVKGDFSLTIIDNGSEDGTQEFLKKFSCKYIDEIVYWKENKGIAEPVRYLWGKSKASYLGKIDNDTLVPPNWLEHLIVIHEKVPDAAVLGGWHFLDSDFDYEKMKHRILEFQGEKILVNSHVGGCSYIIKKSIIDKYGLIANEHGGWTRYQSNLFAEGNIVGYPYPFLKVEHLGDADNPKTLNNKLYKDYVEKFWERNRRKHSITPQIAAQYERKSARKLFEDLRFRGEVHRGIAND